MRRILVGAGKKGKDAGTARRYRCLRKHKTLVEYLRKHDILLFFFTRCLRRRYHPPPQPPAARRHPI